VLHTVGATIPSRAAPPEPPGPLPVPPEVVFPPPAPAAVVAEGELRMELRLAFPMIELFAVVFPGPTRKNVAPRRVRFPVSWANVVRLKFVRLAGIVPFTPVTLAPVCRYIATT